MCIPISALSYLKEKSEPFLGYKRKKEKERAFLTKALEFTTFILLRAVGDWVNGDITESPPSKAAPL